MISDPDMSRPMPSSVARVPSTVRWVGSVAPEVIVAGVSGGQPRFGQRGRGVGQMTGGGVQQQ